MRSEFIPHEHTEEEMSHPGGCRTDLRSVCLLMVMYSWNAGDSAGGEKQAHTGEDGF